MGSRVRIAAAACLVASGLLAGGASASMAFADSPLIGEDSGGKHDSGEKPKSNPDQKKTTPGVGREDENGKGDESGKDPGDVKPGDEQGADDGKNGDNNNGDNGVGNPGNGNCGNSGGNGNASGCGGGGGNDDPDDPPPTKPTTTPTKEEPPPPPPPPEEPGECEDKNKDHCSPGWPWWPWPWPWNPGEPPGPGGGGGGGHPEVPSGRPGVPPQMQLPPELMPPTTGPVGPTVVDVAPGVGIAAAQLPIAPITLPVIVAPAAGLGGGGPAGSPALPLAPRAVTAEPPAGREPLPANVGSNVAVPATSYRIGYTEYLRSAGLSQVVALAVPGVAGMLVLTGAGGLVGYRQAKAGHAVHPGGTARFVN